MQSNRDDFSKAVVLALQGRAGNHCSNPMCQCVTSGPNDHPEKVTKIGVAAHITAAAQGGPRYDSALTPQERSSIFNGIWLCSNCSTLVDKDPHAYSVEKLLEWRHAAESRANNGIKGFSDNMSNTEEDSADWICPYCGTGVEHGHTVCKGCHSEVVYGATSSEREASTKIGLMCGGVIAFLLLVVFPNWLNSTFSWHIAAYWGLGFKALVPAAATAFLFAFLFVQHEDKQRRRNPPRFFRASIA